MAEGDTRPIQDMAERHVDRFKQRLPTLPFGRGQIGEKMVPSGIRWFGHQTSIGRVRVDLCSIALSECNALSAVKP